MHSDGLDALVASGYLSRRFLTNSGYSFDLVILDDSGVYGYLASNGRRTNIDLPTDLDNSVEIRIREDPFAEIGDGLLGHSSVGIETKEMTMDQFGKLSSHVGPGTDVIAADHLLKALRSRREPAELVRVEAARVAVSSALDEAERAVDNASEAEVGRMIDTFLGEMGSQDPTFESNPQYRPYVAYGPHTADVTHVPRSNLLERGQLAVISAGACIDGYWAIESRTLGQAKDVQLLEAMRLVNEVCAWTLDMLSAGQSVRATNKKVKEFLKDARAARSAPHPPCYLSGLTLAEDLLDWPSVGGARVVCIEPGLYVPGRGGVRIGFTKTFARPVERKSMLVPEPGEGQLADARPYFTDVDLDFENADRHSRILLGDYADDWWDGS